MRNFDWVKDVPVVRRRGGRVSVRCKCGAKAGSIDMDQSMESGVESGVKRVSCGACGAKVRIPSAVKSV